MAFLSLYLILFGTILACNLPDFVAASLGCFLLFLTFATLNSRALSFQGFVLNLKPSSSPSIKNWTLVDIFGRKTQVHSYSFRVVTGCYVQIIVHTAKARDMVFHFTPRILGERCFCALT